jgi:predicted dienelactone hydrolase
MGNTNPRRGGWRAVVARGAAACLALIASVAAVAQTAGVVAPLPPSGPYAVGCSNLEQDFSRIPAGESADAFWVGLPRNGSTPRFITDLLVDPGHSFVYQVTFPSDSSIFGSFAGTTFPYALVVCYPTDAGNTRADYPLPTGNVIPHMQRGGEAPIFPAGDKRWPVVVYSHGLSGSPISGDYVQSVVQFASWGYVTIGVFHGDLRFANLNLDSFADVVYALLNYRDFVALQAVRPLSLKGALDVVLGHPDWRDHLDASNVGGFGASLGGESLLLLAGAQLTTTLGQSSTQIVNDPRLKAAVGYVPYFGIDVYPAFGRNLAGLDNVMLPYLALSGTADTTAPITTVQRGMQRLKGTRQLVALTGLKHGYDASYADEINTWMFTFLEGQLTTNEVARATSARMTSVAGGKEDIERIDYMAPSPARDANESVAIEYYNPSLDHYFVTAEPAEAAMLDAGVVVPGWIRTGFAFKARPPTSALSVPTCRFFGTQPGGPNSHFFTIDAAECAKVKANPLWTFEGIAFEEDPPQAGDCPGDRIPVMRIYNNGMGGQASHRYTTSRSETRAMQSNGWLLEGNVFCSLP